MKKRQEGFTLIELLVVVLIIGILAAITLPQYREAIEKAKIQEAIVNLKAIANANERFYMINGRYANANEIDKLDVEIQGEIKGYDQTGAVGDRIATKYFLYSPRFGGQTEAKAVAIRIKDLDGEQKFAYEMYIKFNDRLMCGDSTNGNHIQRKLCSRIYYTGSL